MILITGGAGFIGSVLAKELNLLGRRDLVIVDRLHDADKWRNIRGLKYEEFIHADDIFDVNYEPIWEDVSFIFHLGACSSTTETDVDYLFENNVNFSKNLYQIALERKIPFVYASSAATYGDGSKGYNDCHEDIDCLEPLNPYGYSKQVFDQWVLTQKSKPKHWFGVKFFNVFGPNEYHKEDMRSLVHKAFHQILDTGKVKLFKSHRDDFEDGMQLRDFIYVKDCASVLLQMMNPSSKQFSGIYNLGTGQARSFLDLTKATFAALDKEPEIEFIDMPEKLRAQYQYFTEADVSKFREFLPKFQFTSLEHAVSDYIQNHLLRNNPYY